MAVTYTCETFGILAQTSNDVEREKCIVLTSDILGSATKPDQDVVIDLCKSLCADCGCPYIEKVVDGDFTPIYTKQEVSTDTIEFEIVKSDGTGEVISDQTLGAWVPNESYIANWENIRSKYGGGNYTINLNKNILSVENVECSHTFQLTQPDDCTTNGTVKFNWTQSGSVQDGRVFDPPRQYEARINGFMYEDTPEEEEETYQTNSRKIKMIQKTIKRVYKFKSYPLQYAQKEMIVTNMLIANEFLVSDLNVNTKEFKNKSLYLTGIDSLEDKIGSDYYVVELSFTDLNQTLVKRPC